MIRDDYRNACIEAMTVAYLREIRKPRLPTELMMLVFDALPTALVHVIPVDMSYEVYCLGCREGLNSFYDRDKRRAIRAMLNASDLCNQPEGKP